MSCDQWTYHTAITGFVPRRTTREEPGDRLAAREMDCDGGKFRKKGRSRLTADQTRSKEDRHGTRSRTLPDSTQTKPEYVWGDEGPIND